MASPAPFQAAAAESLVAGCGDTVRGTPGQSVGVRAAGLSVIHLGQVPTSGSTTFDATPIMRDLLGPVAPLCQVTAVALPGASAPVEAAVEQVLGTVQGTVGSVGGVAPQQPAPGPAAPAPGAASPVAALPQPAAPVFGPTLPVFSPFSLGRFHSSLPLYNYAELLVGRPGTFGRLQTGMLNTNLFGTTGSGSLAAQDPAANDVAAAGRATALPASGAERVALPVLVAVLMLAIVAAALIRSWVIATRR